MVSDVKGNSYRTELNVFATAPTRWKSLSLDTSYFVPLNIVLLLVMNNLVDAGFRN